MKRLFRNRFVIASFFVASLAARVGAQPHVFTQDAPHWWCSVCGCNDIEFDPDYHGNIPCDRIIGWFWRCTFNELHDCEANGIVLGR